MIEKEMLNFHHTAALPTSDITEQELLEAINESEIKVKMLEEAGNPIAAREEQRVLDELLVMYGEDDYDWEEQGQWDSINHTALTSIKTAARGRMRKEYFKGYSMSDHVEFELDDEAQTLAHGKIIDFDKGLDEATAIISVKLILDPSGEWVRYYDRDDFVSVPVSELSKASEFLKTRLKNVASFTKVADDNDYYNEVLDSNDDENLLEEAQAIVLETVENFLAPKLKLDFYEWFDCSAGDDVAKTFDHYLDIWFENIAQVATRAEFSGTGDVTAIDYHDYVHRLAEILFKLNPNWETESQEDTYNTLKNWEDEALDRASKEAARELTKSRGKNYRVPFEASAASYRQSDRRRATEYKVEEKSHLLKADALKNMLGISESEWDNYDYLAEKYFMPVYNEMVRTCEDNYDEETVREMAEEAGLEALDKGEAEFYKNCTNALENVANELGSPVGLEFEEDEPSGSFLVVFDGGRNEAEKMREIINAHGIVNLPLLDEYMKQEEYESYEEFVFDHISYIALIPEIYGGLSAERQFYSEMDRKE